MLFNFPSGHLQPGQYSFPFQFMLPGYIPGTFHEKLAHHEGIIRYKIKAEMVNFSNPKEKLKSNQDLIVREPVRQVPYLSRYINYPQQSGAGEYKR